MKLKNIFIMDGEGMMTSSPLVPVWLNQLQASGYRLTGPRRAIVEIILNSPKILSPMEIFDLGRKEYPGLGLVTVYRTIEKLEELSLIQRVHQLDGCHRVTPATQGHQHILLCVSCGQAVYFSGDDLAPLAVEISNKSGFKIMEHWLQLFGLCSGCQDQ
jgi:Fe2+ or Zn2+ uptake regulation protein